MFVLGLGLGQCMQPLLLTMQSAVPPSDIGVATSSATFFRQIGGTIGVAVFLSVLFSTVGGNISSAFAEESQTPAFQQAAATASEDPGSLDARIVAGDPELLASVQDDSSIIEEITPVLAHPFKAGFAESMDTVFLMGSGAGLIAFLILLLMPAVELRATSASAAARTAAVQAPEES